MKSDTKQPNSLWGNIFRGRHKEENIRTILARLPLFEGLSKRELTQIERILHLREFRAGETVFLQGDPGLGMYIVERGVVRIVQEPGKNMLAELTEGDFFGELALLEEWPRSATAVTETPCRLFCLFQPDLLDLIDRAPQLGVKILLRLVRTIGERLNTTNELLQRLQKNGHPDGTGNGR